MIRGSSRFIAEIPGEPEILREALSLKMKSLNSEPSKSITVLLLTSLYPLSCIQTLVSPLERLAFNFLPAIVYSVSTPPAETVIVSAVSKSVMEVPPDLPYVRFTETFPYALLETEYAVESIVTLFIL